MGIIIALANGLLLLQLFACYSEAVGPEKKPNASGKSGIRHRTFRYCGFCAFGNEKSKESLKNETKLEESLKKETESEESFTREMFDSHCHRIGERLRHIESEAKAGLGMLKEADRQLLTMARCHQLLKSAVGLQNKFEAFFNGRLKSRNQQADVKDFENDIDAIMTIDSKGSEQHIMDKSVVLEMEAQNLEVAIRQNTKNYGKKYTMTEEIKRTQRNFDRSVQALAQTITRKPNIFVQLQKAGQVLELASSLRKAINTCAENSKLGKVAEIIEQTTVRAYNAFARQLGRLGAAGDGPHRDLYEQFQLADIDRKIEENEAVERRPNFESGGAEDLMRVLDAEHWKYIRQLLHDYYQLGLPPMDEVKIRGNGHIVLCIGPIEYDYIDRRDIDYGVGTRRRKFRDDLDEYTSVTSLEKAVPLAERKLVSLAKADEVFFAMVENGWDGHSYDLLSNRFCGTFVWRFLCQLLDGECPDKEKMPPSFNFLAKERSNSQSIFADPYFPSKPDDSPKNCALKSQELQLHYTGSTSVTAIELPPIIEYETGKYSGFQLVKPFASQEQAKEVLSVADEGSSSAAAAAAAAAAALIGHDDVGHVRRFTANLMVYVCKEKNGSRDVALVHNLRVYDQKYQKLQFRLRKLNGGEEKEYYEKEYHHFVDLLNFTNKHGYLEVYATGDGGEESVI